MAAFLDDGRVDLVAGGLVVTPERALRMRFTDAVHGGDPRVGGARPRAAAASPRPALREAGALRIATLRRAALRQLSSAARCRTSSWSAIAAPREFFEAPPGTLRRLAGHTAEGGSAWTLIHPRWRGGAQTQCHHRTDRVRHAERRAGTARLREHLDRAQTRQDGSTRHLYDFWTCGVGAHYAAVVGDPRRARMDRLAIPGEAGDFRMRAAPKRRSIQARPAPRSLVFLVR